MIVAVADPTDEAGIGALSRKLNASASLRLATLTEITEQIDRRFGPKLIGVLPTGEKLEYPIALKEIEIGKAPHNHIVLDDPTVSNTHAILIVRDGGYSIVDLGSRNGTFVDGERLGVHGRTLRHGDAIQLGQTVLTFRNPEETAANVTAVLSLEAAEEARKRAGLLERDAKDSASAGDKAATPPPSSLVPPAPDFAQSELESTPEPVTSIAPDAEPAPSTDGSAGEVKGEKKKKKKEKKKKGSDERMRAAYIGGLSRIVAQIMGVVLAVALALYVNHTLSSKPPSNTAQVDVTPKGGVKPKLQTAVPGTRFEGGAFEASGVTQVPGTNAVLIVDDNRPGEVLWMELDQSGRQAGAIKPIALGVTVDDPEGITFDDPYFYIVGSQSNPKGGEKNALVRFTFDSTDQSVKKVEVLADLRGFLLQSVPELGSEGAKKGEEGGLNIEGIALDPDPQHRRLLLGLRSPLIGADALIVPIRLRDPHGPFSAGNLQIAGPGAIRLPLGGLGVRDIQYDSRFKSFLIIAGAAEHHEKTDFVLFEWSGADSKPREEARLDSKMKPEGITRATVGAREFIFIVADAGSYTMLDYSSP